MLVSEVLIWIYFILKRNYLRKTWHVCTSAVSDNGLLVRTYACGPTHVNSIEHSSPSSVLFMWQLCTEVCSHGQPLDISPVQTGHQAGLNPAFTPILSLQETYEAKRKEFLVDLQRKEEEMRQMFVNKVKETEAELKEKEKEVRASLIVTLFHSPYCVWFVSLRPVFL